MGLRATDALRLSLPMLRGSGSSSRCWKSYPRTSWVREKERRSNFSQSWFRWSPLRLKFLIFSKSMLRWLQRCTIRCIELHNFRNRICLGRERVPFDVKIIPYILFSLMGSLRKDLEFQHGTIFTSTQFSVRIVLCGLYTLNMVDALCLLNCRLSGDVYFGFVYTKDVTCWSALFRFGPQGRLWLWHLQV